MLQHHLRSHWIAASVLFAGSTLTPPLQAQSHPEMAGAWSADIPASTATGMALPLSATCTIEYAGDSIIVKRLLVGAYGPLESRLVVRSDGKPTTSKISVYAGAPGGGTPEKVDLDASVVGRWAHDTLVVSVSSDLHGRPMEQLSRLVVSADHKTLMEHRSTSVDGNAGGTQDLRYKRTK